MAQELTTTQKNALAQKSFSELIKWKQIAGMSYLQLGKLLKNFKEQKLYENLGEESPEYESFEIFLQMPEINIKLRKAYYLIQIYDLFCIQLKFKPEELSEVSWTSLRSLLPVIRQENSRDLIQDAKTLTRGHLEVKIEQMKSGITAPEECKHKEVNEIVFYICNHCKDRFKTPPPDSKVIKE